MSLGVDMMSCVTVQFWDVGVENLVVPERHKKARLARWFVDKLL